MTSLVSAVSSDKAIAGAAGAVGIQLAAPAISRIPGVGTPVGRIVAGVVIAFIGVKFLDGAAEAVVVGIGAGLAAQGIASMIMPQLVSA